MTKDGKKVNEKNTAAAAAAAHSKRNIPYPMQRVICLFLNVDEKNVTSAFKGIKFQKTCVSIFNVPLN